MKCIAISDTHSKMDRISIPPCDFLFHAGDGTMAGTPNECDRWMSQMAATEAKHKIFIAGNHDWLAQKNEELFRRMALNFGLIYLRDEVVEIDGLKIYGSPWQPWFHDWAFNLERGDDIAEKWDMIPSGLDVLITHGPPEAILDVPGGADRGGVGCKDLLDKVLVVKPKVHIFGHIHGSYGEKMFMGTHFINASIMDEGYSPSHEPIEFEL